MKSIHPFSKLTAMTALSISLLLSSTLLGGVARAQVAAEVEGPVSAITDHGDGTASMTVMDILVKLDSNTVINSPTAALSIRELADRVSLPGRTQPGFVGGTAIVIGNSYNGIIHALNITIEPAENVVIGEITANNDTAGCIGGMQPADRALFINGVPITFLNDARMPFGEATNEGGFPINPCSLTPGDSVAIEGYFTSQGLYVFGLTSDDADTAGHANQTAITRVQCRERAGRLEARGATTASSGTVTLIDESSGSTIGSAGVTTDLSGGVFRLRVNVTACPQIVRATHDDGSFGVAEVQIQ
jgi:hypothetical protein